jgi:hypothetical protein
MREFSNGVMSCSLLSIRCPHKAAMAQCCVALALVVLLALAASASASSTCVMNTTQPYRLPWSVIPSSYSLSLTPDLVEYKTFTGMLSFFLLVLSVFLLAAQ